MSCSFEDFLTVLLSSPLLTRHQPLLRAYRTSIIQKKCEVLHSWPDRYAISVHLFKCKFIGFIKIFQSPFLIMKVFLQISFPLYFVCLLYLFYFLFSVMHSSCLSYSPPLSYLVVSHLPQSKQKLRAMQ